jgi:nicotinate-nucleotide--dimethylbenzimidazole phosphoribosyltransferase
MITSPRSTPAGPVLPLDVGAQAQARALLDALAMPPGALGRVQDLAVWLAGVHGCAPPRRLTRPRVVVVAGDHGTAARTSAYPPAVTPLMVRTMVAGRAAVNVLAAQVGAEVTVLDLAVDADLSGLPAGVVAGKVRRGSRPIDVADALTEAEASQAFDVGVAAVEAATADGVDLLVVGDMGIGNTTPAAALTAALTDAEVVDVVGRGTGIDDDTWSAKVAVVRDAVFRARGRTDGLDLLAALGGADLAAMTGMLVTAARLRLPVVVDGVVVGAAALAAERIAPGSRQCWQAGHRSPEPAHAHALRHLEMRPLLDLELRLGEGTGAVLALPLVLAASALLHDMASLASVLAGDLPGPD